MWQNCFCAIASLLVLAIARSITPDHDPVSLSARYDRVAIDKARAEAVKDMFKFAWDGYYTHAFPKDALRPLNNSGWNPRNGWAASAIDALDTAIIMGLDDTVQVILEHVPKIDSSISADDSTVSLFETTIRYLGGMLAAYDLLTGPYSHMTRNQEQITALLDQSRHLGDILSFAFDTPTGIPFNQLRLSNKTNVKTGEEAETMTGLAVAGSLVLEWQHLSDVSGDDKYGLLAQRAESYLLTPQPAASEPFPGLLGVHINTTTGDFISAKGSWDGSNDSFYEYLIKMYIYKPSKYEVYKDRWIAAVESSITHLLRSPAGHPDIKFFSRFDDTKVIHEMGHLSCFAGGSFILGGLMLEDQRIIDSGLKLVEGCLHTYQATATGIGPEYWSWNASYVPDDQVQFFAKHGFWVINSIYLLRPEHMESLYYAYRATGDVKYQDLAWQAITHINHTTRMGSGFSSINNVTDPDGGSNQDDQESFVFAELLKYAYLLFAGENEVQVAQKSGDDKWVYNTEAHPFKIQNGDTIRGKWEKKVFNGSPVPG